MRSTHGDARPVMRLCGLGERCLTPRRVASSGGMDEGEGEDPEAEVFRNLWKQRRLLPPTDSPYSKRRRWQYFLLFLVAYEQIYMPLQLAFQVPRPNYGSRYQLPAIQLAVQYLIDICFLFA